VSEPRTPAEERLAALFLLLVADAPRPSEALREAVMRGVRRQHLLRSALAVIEELLAALVRGLAVVLGLRPPRPPRTVSA
jgi:hypothetical protein